LRNAIAALEKAAELKPKDAPTLYLLASTYNRMQNYAKALDVARRGLQLNNREWDSHLAWEAGIAAKGVGKFQTAITYFQRASKNSSYKEAADFEIKQLQREARKSE